LLLHGCGYTGVRRVLSDSRRQRRSKVWKLRLADCGNVGSRFGRSIRPVIAPVDGGATCDMFAATLRLPAFPCPALDASAGQEEKAE